MSGLYEALTELEWSSQGAGSVDYQKRESETGTTDPWGEHETLQPWAEIELGV